MRILDRSNGHKELREYYWNNRTIIHFVAASMMALEHNYVARYLQLPFEFEKVPLRVTEVA
jgi:hypothetical protein